MNTLGHNHLLTVIVPAYNAEKQISQTLQSLLNQTVSPSEYQIIVIDDGSTDNTYAIGRDFADRYPNLRILHQENKGVSSARNLGIEHASGKWVSFVDSDDFVARTYVETLVTTAVSDDLVLFPHDLDHPGNLCPDKNWMRPYYDSPQNPDDVLAWVCDNRLNTPWDKRYSLQILQEKSIRFPEAVSLAEDLLFNFQYALYISSAYISSRAVYVYTDNWDGICRTQSAVKRLQDYGLVFQNMHDLCLSRHLDPSYSGIINQAFLRNIARCAGQLSASGMPAREIAALFRENTMVQSVLRERPFSLKNRIRKLLLTCRLYRLCYILLRQK